MKTMIVNVRVEIRAEEDNEEQVLECVEQALLDDMEDDILDFKVVKVDDEY